MKGAVLTIRVDENLHSEVKVLAKRERRTMADQSAYLIELGIRVLEKQLSQLMKTDIVPRGSDPAAQ